MDPPFLLHKRKRGPLLPSRALFVRLHAAAGKPDLCLSLASAFSVPSSTLSPAVAAASPVAFTAPSTALPASLAASAVASAASAAPSAIASPEIGRASCRERVCQYV